MQNMKWRSRNFHCSNGNCKNNQTSFNQLKTCYNLTKINIVLRLLVSVHKINRAWAVRDFHYSNGNCKNSQTIFNQLKTCHNLTKNNIVLKLLVFVIKINRNVGLIKIASIYKKYPQRSSFRFHFLINEAVKSRLPILPSDNVIDLTRINIKCLKMETSNIQQTLYLGLINKDHLHLQELSTALMFSIPFYYQRSR